MGHPYVVRFFARFVAEQALKALAARLASIEDRAHQHARSQEVAWKVSLSQVEGLDWESEALHSAVEREIHEDTRFWATIWSAGELKPILATGVEEPLMQKLPFEDEVETTWQVVTVVCWGCSLEESRERLRSLRDDPDGLYQEIGLALVQSLAGRQATVLLRWVPIHTVEQELSRLATMDAGKQALRMRVYRAAELFWSHGGARSQSSDEAIWRQFLASRGYEGDELDEVVNAIMAHEYQE